MIESDGPWIEHLDNWSWMSFHGLTERRSEYWVVDAVGLGFTIELFSAATAFLRYALLCLAAQSCPTLSDPMNCSSPGSSVHGILQARILEWVAIPFSRGSSQPRDQTRVSCIAGRFFTAEPPGKKTPPRISQGPPPLSHEQRPHSLLRHPRLQSVHRPTSAQPG